MTDLHPFQRRLLAEDFSRIRRPDERRRYAASQRRGRIDANPHQVDAVAFALGRIPDGGCILADEVGLGKTIEAGLVIAQLLAEGSRRILLILPKSLLGQWQTELYALFGIEARQVQLDPDTVAGDGVFLVNREFAGGLRGAPLLSSADPFDLVVIDEAHELFASIYKRFNKQDRYVSDAKHAQTAHRVREFLKSSRTPVLLLTATPIQNSLLELWGLVHFVQPRDQLLGSLSTFRKVFANQDTREQGLGNEEAFELRQRLRAVLQRTLRRQAQAFLEVPFVERQAKTIEYSVSEEERELYHDITAWLMSPELYAFRAINRRILVVGFHRRMASSLAALVASLENVANRSRDELAGETPRWDDVIRDFAADLEEDLADFALEGDAAEAAEETDDSARAEVERTPRQQRMEGVRQELHRVEAFIERARGIEHDSKGECLLTTLQVIRDRADRGDGTGKVVIFTESLKTQDYLFDLLTKHGYPPTDITLFRGSNSHARARDAVRAWKQEVEVALPEANRPGRQVAERLALVHEFKTRSRIFISTEAGAKGLNLQFCETLINYDLPWNPQRIEQRIGRVHRYGQQLGVSVFNLIDRGNDAQKLTYEILSQKLDLFGRVLDASDHVLHSPDELFPESIVASLGEGFESQLRRIYQQSTSLDEVSAQLRTLRDAMEERREAFDTEQQRAAQLIERELDESVSQVFRRYQAEVPACLEEIDREIDVLVSGFLTSRQIDFDRDKTEGQIHYRIAATERLPEGLTGTGSFVVGECDDLEDGQVLFPGHPLVEAAISEAREATAQPLRACVTSASLPEPLESLAGRRAKLLVSKLRYRGLVPVDRLVITLLPEGELDPLESVTLEHLLDLQVEEVPPSVATPEWDPELLDEVVEEGVLDDQQEIRQIEDRLFDRKLEQLDRYLDDQVVVLKQQETAQLHTLEESERKRSKANSPTALETLNQTLTNVRQELARIEQRMSRIQSGEDPNYKEWRERLLSTRYKQPKIERILDVDLYFDEEALRC